MATAIRRTGATNIAVVDLALVPGHSLRALAPASVSTHTGAAHIVRATTTSSLPHTPAPHEDQLKLTLSQALTSARQIRTLEPADADAWAHYYLGAECEASRAADAVLAAVGL